MFCSVRTPHWVIRRTMSFSFIMPQFFRASITHPDNTVEFFQTCSCTTNLKALIERDLMFLHSCLHWPLGSSSVDHFSRSLLYSLLDVHAVSRTDVELTIYTLKFSRHQRLRTIIHLICSDLWWVIWYYSTLVPLNAQQSLSR